jgi:hypothetical protein
VTGLLSDGALVVRPDNFVGWRTEQLPEEPAVEPRRVLAAILGRGEWAGGSSRCSLMICCRGRPVMFKVEQGWL